GWDGVETVGRLWAVAAVLQVVICTAFSDYTWARILERLKRQDGLLILKKPFDGIEVLQLAHSLATKWFLQREVSRRFIDLQALIAERTQALSEANRALREEIHRREQTEQQLVESQKLEGLGQLAAGIAHEINNPMAFVTANVQCLAADLRGIPALPEPLREYRDEVIPATLEGIARVNAIVADVGRFALADPGTELEYDLNHEVQNAVRIVQGRVKSSQRLQAELGKLPPLRGKPSQIAQVAVNLLANALHATDGGGLVRVRTYAEGDEQVLEVADDGPGVAPEARKKLFVPFFTTKAVGDGPGLGLSVIHGIVKAHGGRIDVRSEPGLGTSFVVRLPMAPAQA